MSKNRKNRMSGSGSEDAIKELRERFRHATAVALQIPEEMIPMQVDRNSSKHITMEMWAEAGSFDMIAEPGDTVDEEIAEPPLAAVHHPPKSKSYRVASGSVPSVVSYDKLVLVPPSPPLALKVIVYLFAVQ